MNESNTRRQYAAMLVVAIFGTVGCAIANPVSADPALPLNAWRTFPTHQTLRAEPEDQGDTDLPTDLACVPADESQGPQCAAPNAVNDERSYDRDLMQVMLALHGRRPMRALAHACATGILDLALDEEFAANAIDATSFADSP